jgi:hypothetical protein
MAGMYQPSIREVTPNGRYVPAIDWRGLPARWPVCTPAIDWGGMAWLAVQERIWPLWQFHATVGQYGGWCWWGNAQLGGSGPLHGQIGGSKPQLAILAGQYHHRRASTAIVKLYLRP